MIAIVKYNAGNVMSVQNAIERLGYKSIVSDDETVLNSAEKVILPGVGEASSAMKYLKQKNLDHLISNLEQPLLGICLGLQLMCEYSEEGNTKGIGIFKTKVRLFAKEEKVPHIGWNNFSSMNSKLLKGISKEDDVYYVHSYYAEPCADTKATCDYILPFSAVLEKDNFYATQFHPEKSASVGEQILKNFLAI